MTKSELDRQRHALVVKSNDLIRQSRFDLTTKEQKIVLYLVSKIKKGDLDFSEVEFSVREFCAVCGIKYKGSSESIKETIKKLRDKSIWVSLNDGSETAVAWIEKPYVNFNSGIIRVRLDKDMLPYLLQLKGNFTTYELYAVLGLRSKFSLRLYELFKSYLFEGGFNISLSKLKSMLMIDESEYPKFYDFRRYVIDKSINEIQGHTSLRISYSYIKDSRSVSGISFVITDYIKQSLHDHSRIVEFNPDDLYVLEPKNIKT